MQIVWFSEIKWDYLRTRKQQLISRMPDDVELLYLEPYRRGGWNRYRLRREGRFCCATVPFPKSAPSSLARRVLGWGWVRGVVEYLGARRVAELMRRLGFEGEKTGFIVSNIYAVEAALSLPRCFLLYDCNDDHSSFPGTPAWASSYFQRACREANLVVASSRALMEKVTAIRRDGKCTLLGNGVEFDRFPARRSFPTDRIRLGYIGALAPWVDFDIIAAVAEAHPDWEIVLVGPVMGGVEGRLMQLTSLANVHRMVPVAYERVPNVLDQFSIGLIPFRRNDLTRGVNPNKLYEYMAAGLPVVATSFSPELEGFPGVVRAVATKEDFVSACEEAVALVSGAGAGEVAARARDWARRYDWNQIAVRFWQEVRELMS